MISMIMGRFNWAVKAVILILAAVLTSPAEAWDQPPRVLIDSYDPAHVNGLVLIGNDRNIFALRCLVYRPGGQVEEAPPSFELGPHAPNGSYASLVWRTRFNDQQPVIWRWSRVGTNAVVGRLSAPPNVRVALEVYRPWSEVGDEGWVTFLTKPDKRTILGEQVNSQKSAASLKQFVLRTDRPGAGAASYEDRTAMRKALVTEGYAQQAVFPERSGLNRYAALSFDLSQETSVGFVAMIGDGFEAMESEAERLLQRPVLESLDRAEKKYEGERALSGGSLGDGLEAISRTISWNRFYNPDKQLEFAEIHRSSGRSAGPESDPDRQPRGPVLSWDTFWTASLAAMIDPGVAASTVQVLPDGQTPDGRLPLRRSLYHRPRQEPATLAGRSMPPIGSFCVWKIYLATSDLSLLAAAYPRLLMWNEWWTKDRGDGKLWRDGDGDGLLEWGFDPELEQGALGAQAIPASAKRKLAISESGLEDRLQWTSGEEFGAGPRAQEDGIKYNNGTHTLEFSPVGLNALYALDTEVLSMMARELNLPDDVSRLQQRYERIRFNINEKLWSEADGAYLNRRWDGSFSRRLSLENFYPLLAGLADEDRARRMVRLLSQKFWGGQPLSFIARDDPAFHPQGVGRGAVWSLTNYLFYLGLKRYRFQAEAGEIARKSTVMGRAAWEQTRKLSDYYSSSDGIMIEESELLPRPQVTGMIFWPGIEELIGMDLWSGFSIGSLSATEEARVERIRFLGSTFDAVIGPKRTVVRRQGQVELECEAPVKLRMYRSAEHTLGFVIETKANVQLTVPAVEERKITVSVDDQVLGATSPGAAATFKVPAGTHRVFIVK